MNWKEQFDPNNKEGKFSDLAHYIDRASNTDSFEHPFSEVYIKDLTDFISTEIIAKLIADIKLTPVSKVKEFALLTKVQQDLKSKWL